MGLCSLPTNSSLDLFLNLLLTLFPSFFALPLHFVCSSLLLTPDHTGTHQLERGGLREHCLGLTFQQLY